MTTIDFGQLMKDAGEGFKPVPPGPYNAVVTKAEAVASGTGKPMIKVQLRIVGGPCDGRMLFDQFVISAGNPNALSFFFQHMAAFGLDAAFFASNPELPYVAQTLLNRQIMCSVGIKQYKGADRNEVQAYNSISGGGVGAIGAGGGPAAFGPGAGVPQAAPIAPVAAPVAPAPPPVAPVAAPAPPPVAPPAPPVAAPIPPAPAPPVAAPIPPAPVADAPIAPPAAVIPAPQPIAPPPAAIAPQPAYAPEVPVPGAAIPAPTEIIYGDDEPF